MIISSHNAKMKRNNSHLGYPNVPGCNLIGLSLQIQMDDVQEDHDGLCLV